ncbi:MAG: extracellular solute-binding protein [Clostridia bacterium]|nr:extracellular solute-binding protein [Clostridia bacterium]
MNKKITAILLAILMIVPAMFTACSQSTENASNGDTGTATDAQTPTAGGEEIAETEPERLFADVPDSDFGGEDFLILCSSNAEYGGVKDDFFAEELTGEAINDARFNRNATVGDKLNIKIVTDPVSTGSDVGKNAITTDVKSGTGTYDLAFCCGYATSSLSTNGYLYNLKNVPYIDLEKPWWDQVANQDLQILGQLFYTTGDISTADNDATYCIMFNKQLIKDYNMQSPYDLVSDDKWTMDNFINMAEQVHEDTNGNGKVDRDDLFGVMIWDDSMMGVVNCTGEKCCTVGDDGLLTLTIYSEKTVDAVTKFLDFALQKDIADAYQRTNWDDTWLVTKFSQNETLFLMQLIQIVPKMREMENDFGILPYFKYEEGQKNYYTTIGSWHSVFMCVPNNGCDLNRTGIVTESLANEGLYDLTVAYYEKTLVGKMSRDEESEAMLDIIFANRVFDMGWYYAIGGYNESVMNLLRNYKNDFTSMYTSAQKMANKVLQKTNDAFLEAYQETNP